MSVQRRYDLLHISFWFMSACSLAFIAVFLQFKGLDTAQIGLVTGGACLCSVMLAGPVSSLTSRFPGLPLAVWPGVGVAASCGLYLVLTWVAMPSWLLMGLYVVLYFLNTTMVPFLSGISMGLLRQGYKLNFGLSRGLGSVAYAACALVMGQVIAAASPALLAPAGAVASLGFLASLASLPRVMETSSRTSTSAVSLALRYPSFFAILLGFGLMMAGATSLSTYLIHIVRAFGGNDGTYGLCVFCMACSELPVMAATPSLQSRFGTRRLLAAASAFYLVRNFTVGLAGGLPMVILGLMFQGASYGMFTALLAYYVKDRLSLDDQVMGQTLIAIMTTGFGSGLGNVMGGLLQAQSGLQAMCAFAMGITVLGALVTVFVTAGSGLLRRMRTVRAGAR